MSILRVANLQFNASGTRRIDYDAVADDGVIKISADAIKLPVGDTASRPTLQPGMLRYNSQLDLFEGANSTTWGSIGGTVDFATANGWANTVATAGNNYTNAVGVAGNNYTNYVGASANSWANAVGQNANVYAYATAVSIGGAGNNYTYFSIVPVWNTANAAYGVANTALQNTSGVSFNGNFYIPSGSLGVGNTTPGHAKVHITSANTVGGVGYADFLRVTNASYPAITNPIKTFRLNQTGGLEVINDAYTAVIMSLGNDGSFGVGSRGISKASMPSGSILQIQQTVKSDTFVSSSASWVDVTGMSVDITPTSSSSKILVSFAIHGTTVNVAYVKLQRNGSDIAIGDAASNRIRCTAGNFNVGGDGNTTYLFTQEFLDSPGTTSTLTYKLQFRHESGGSNWHVNRTVNDPDSSTGMRGISTITVMEIAG